MKPDPSLQGDCNSLDMEIFKKAFDDWMSTASGEEGVPFSVYIKMFATCIDTAWKTRLGPLETYINRAGL